MLHSEHDRPPSFHPPLQGCVSRDPCMANAVGESYLAALYAVTSYLYRAMRTEHGCKPISELFERLAREEMMHFRTLGELILALGGNPAICTHLRIGASEPLGIGGTVGRMLSDSLCEERRGIDRYQTLMGCTRDRVVRSVLAQILDDKSRHVEALTEAVREESC